MLDRITAGVRRLGPLPLAVTVTAGLTVLSALATIVAMRLTGNDLFPPLYLAIGTPLGLALPVTYLAFLAIEKLDAARAEQAQSEAAATTAEATLRDAIESIPNPTMVFGPDDRMRFRNRAWCLYYPALDDDVQPGLHYEDLVRAVVNTGMWDSMGSREEILESRLRHHRAAAGTLVQELADGRFILANTSRSRDGGTIVTHTDITDLKRVDNLKDEFVSMVSHELRTPITSIKGSLDLLAAAFVDGKEIDVPRFVDIARRNAERMLLIVNDILVAQGIQAGGLAFDSNPTPIVPLVERTLATNVAFADLFGVSFRFHGAQIQASVDVDPQRFGQVLTNLLSNAAKFAPRDSVVDVTVTCENAQVRIAVHDDGPGIPADLHEQIFERFWRADVSETRGASGTGLGLNIARQMAEGMGGRIGLESEQGRGTTFYIELPLVDDAAARQAFSEGRSR
ncbi:MAG: PAS-domain containing protein [Alphaproteobacteria bacterium]|nr:PAS-domain containing protein [Alphaproteobacteria bacterium]